MFQMWFGTINNVKKIIKYAHKKGAVVIVDASQSIPHMKIDVQDLDADFLVFSGHKMLGPMGIGVLYAKKEILEKMNPFLMGGDMIEYVYEQDTTFAPLPNKFEAGTQNVEGVIGLGAAIDYIQKIGYDKNVAVLTQPEYYQKKKNRLMPLIRLKYRRYPKLVETMANRHLVYNAALNYIKDRERQGELKQARRLYHLAAVPRAVATAADLKGEKYAGEANLRLFHLYRRQGEWEKAEETLLSMLRRRQMGRVPSLELCKLYEHRLKRPGDALKLAENLLKDCPADERAALEHRVERLKRKVRESGGNDHGIHGKL